MRVYGVPAHPIASRNDASMTPIHPSDPHRPETFRAYFDRDFSGLVALAASITGDVVFAEDLAQEAMTRAHRKWDEIAELDKPGAWVRRVLINLALSRRRRAAREAAALLGLRPTRPSMFATETNSPVLELLAELPPRQRAVISLHYIEDLPVDDVADIVGVAPSTVRTHLDTARQTLRARLMQHERTAAADKPIHPTLPGENR